MLLSTPWQPDSVVTVDIFLNVRGIQSSTAESGPVTWSRRAGVVAPSSSVRLTWPSIIEYELYPSEDENRNAKSCALVLFKAWKLDHLPAVPSSHVAWAVMDCTKIDGINFNDRKGSKRGKALNVLKAAVLALETQYLDTTGSQPPMFRRDIGNDSLMMALGYKLRAFRMSLGDVSTLLLQEK